MNLTDDFKRDYSDHLEIVGCVLDKAYIKKENLIVEITSKFERIPEALKNIIKKDILPEKYKEKLLEIKIIRYSFFKV